MVTVTIDGVLKQYAEGTSFEQIAEEYQAKYENLITSVCVDGKIRELFKTVTKDCNVSFFTLKDSVGFKT